MKRTWSRTPEARGEGEKRWCGGDSGGKAGGLGNRTQLGGECDGLEDPRNVISTSDGIQARNRDRDWMVLWLLWPGESLDPSSSKSPRCWGQMMTHLGPSHWLPHSCPYANHFLTTTFLGGEGHWIQSLVHARQVFYPLSYAPSPFLFILCLRQGLTNFAKAGLKLMILLPPQKARISVHHCATMPGLPTRF
jgi:hypothetical protein